MPGFLLKKAVTRTVGRRVIAEEVGRSEGENGDGDGDGLVLVE